MRVRRWKSASRMSSRGILARVRRRALQEKLRGDATDPHGIGCTTRIVPNGWQHRCLQDPGIVRAFDAETIVHCWIAVACVPDRRAKTHSIARVSGGARCAPTARTRCWLRHASATIGTSAHTSSRRVRIRFRFQDAAPHVACSSVRPSRGERRPPHHTGHSAKYRTGRQVSNRAEIQSVTEIETVVDCFQCASIRCCARSRKCYGVRCGASA
jgi:hypothetical protein